MRVLQITDFDDKPIGSIWVSADGQVQMEIHDPAFEQDMASLVRRITAEPVPMRTGRRLDKDGIRTFISQVKHCRPGDPDFLAAVRDRVNRLRWQERRLYGRLTEKAASGEGGCDG